VAICSVASRSVAHRTALYGVLFMMGADTFLTPMLIPAIAHDFGSNVAHAAYSVAAFGAAYAVSSPLTTGLLHSRSSRGVISGGLVIVVCACASAIAAPNLAVLVLARAASGLGAAVVNPTVWSQLQASAAEHARGRVMLGGTAVSAAGQVVGIPVGTTLAAHGDWRIALGALAMGFAVMLVATRAVLSPCSANAQNDGRPQTAISGVLDGLQLWRLSAFSFAIVGNVAAQAARLGTYSYIAAMFAEQYSIGGGGLGIIGIVAGTGSLAGAVIATVVVSWWCRRELPVLGFSVLATVVMFVGITLMTANTYPCVNLIGLGISFAAGITIFGTGQFYMTSALPGNRTAISWNSSAMYIGAAMGTYALGLTKLGSAAFTTVSLVFVVIAAISFSIPIWGERHIRAAGSA
jgi:predicted MFS family arabinose efflux permease